MDTENTATGRLTSLWQQGVQLMTEGYTCAEVALRVLSQAKGWDLTTHQWATAGYAGAIASGKATCGLLVGATIFLGLLHGEGTGEPPTAQSEARSRAIAAVNDLYREFIAEFGDTDCRTLTGCDWSVAEDVKRYYKDEVYNVACFRQWEVALRGCFR